MAGTNRVVHFEIHAENPERAVQFYSTVFAWKIAAWEGTKDYWLLTTGDEGDPGINGGLVRRRGSNPLIPDQPVNAFVCTIDVASLEETVKKVTSAGGIQVVDKMPVPGVGWLAYCKDTEGNIFGIIQSDDHAGV